MRGELCPLDNKAMCVDLTHHTVANIISNNIDTYLVVHSLQDRRQACTESQTCNDKAVITQNGI